MVREHRKARLNSRFDAEWLPDSPRVRYRIYKLSAELMKFYIARKPTYASRSLILELASMRGFLIKSGLFEQPRKGWTSILSCSGNTVLRRCSIVQKRQGLTFT
ncbi:hypothetical protein D5F53_03325 [Paenibacillus lautus]|uniref:Uncharacterized protein n=1 Tax=Paenibacillus lautus TaxID=1401 RepID=A0A385THB0_PAELA|nr:hypothetical protein D5F53_03325 [Paenibacillus lautus]